MGAPLTRIELGTGVVPSSDNQKSASAVPIFRRRHPKTQAAPCELCESVRVPSTQKKTFRMVTAILVSNPKSQKKKKMG